MAITAKIGATSPAMCSIAARPVCGEAAVFGPEAQ
jgi:hypothetical protein